MIPSIVALLIAAVPAVAQTSPFDFHYSSADVARACAAAKAKAEDRLAGLSSSSPEAATFVTSFVAFADAVSDLSDETSLPMFMGHVSTDQATRDAGLACDTDISQYLVDVYSREGLYGVLKGYAAKGERLDGEDQRLVEKTLLDFKRNGLDLPPAQRAQVKGLKQRVIALQTGFAKAIGETKETVPFTKDQLAGLPEDFVARLPKDGDKFLVSLDYPDYYPFMENAKDPEARRRLEARFNSRGGAENVKRLEEALKLRAETANILGYPSHAHYVLDDRMAKTPETVDAFLRRLEARLKEKAVPELAVLVGLKGEEEGAKSSGGIEAWDWLYYHNKLLKTRYEVDDQKIKEYFPVDVVVAGLLDVYQRLFGLKFKEAVPALAWHEDVKLYEVADAEGGPAFAYFYMDLYPREGKYKHAAAFTLRPGRLLPNGTYQKPVSSIVANFNKPMKGAPSLLTHKEVETFFHEFGHIVHQVLTKAKYERFSGTNVAQDFVEAASQMLENWVWKEDILKSLSGHYKGRSKKLPPELLKKMIAAKNVDSGLYYLRQNFFATLDAAYHATPPTDSTALYAQLKEQVSLVPMSEGTIPQAGFGHLMGGYDAGYYGYLWSEVYAQDMFSRFEAEGLLAPAVGRDWRRKILEPGGSVEEAVSLRSFLGREPNDDAFLKNIGLDPKK